jgi:hypothetical protein
MSILKTGLVAVSLCFAASLAHADSSVPVQGLASWNAKASVSQPRMAKTWTGKKANAPFSREALEDKSGH